MSGKLNIGVYVYPYAEGMETKPMDTGIAADEMEKKFKLFSLFSEIKEKEINQAMTESIADYFNGDSKNLEADVGSKVTELMRTFILKKEHNITPRTNPLPITRLKNVANAGNYPRIMFVDTGLLLDSMTAWIE